MTPLLVPLLLASLQNTTPSQGAWSQWRGPERTGRLAGGDVPQAWPDSLRLAWELPVGTGHGSPVTDGRLVFVLTRRGEEEVASAVRRDSGELAWERTYPVAIGINPYASKHGRWPRSTPLLHDGALITLGADATLSCWESATGELRWRRAREGGVDTRELFCGSSTSPLVVGGNVIVHVGDDGGGRFVAYDLSEGREVWGTELEGPGYASPVRALLDGVDQLVTLTQSRVVSVALADGALLWSQPFDDKWNENIVTPIVLGERVLVSGVRRGTHVVRPRHGGEGWELEVPWASRETKFYMSTPVEDDGVVYGFTPERRGQLVALDGASGDRLWARAEEAESAALVRAGERLVVLTTAGELVVGAANPDGWREERRYTVSESACWAHPLVSADGVLVKDASSLRAFLFAGKFADRTRVDAHGVSQVFVPPGVFRMGTDGEPPVAAPAWAVEELASERPAHEVEITHGFWIDRTEVTVAQFERFVEDGGYERRELWSEAGWEWMRRQDPLSLPLRVEGERPDHPRVGVSWYEAEA